MLACDCDYGDDPAWWHEGMGEIKPLATKRMRRCCSCKERIAVGEDCAAIKRWRTPNYDSIEERIYGEGGEIWLATWYMCDRCAGLCESLDGLGFCNLIGQDMRELCREYAQMQRDAGVFHGQMVVNPKTPNVGGEARLAAHRPPHTTTATPQGVASTDQLGGRFRSEKD